MWQCVTSRLEYKEGFFLALSLVSPALGEASYHVMEILNNLMEREVHVERNWGPMPTAKRKWDFLPISMKMSLLKSWSSSFSQDNWGASQHLDSNLTETSWARTTQLSCSQISDPQKIWDNKRVLFWATIHISGLYSVYVSCYFKNRSKLSNVYWGGWNLGMIRNKMIIFWLYSPPFFLPLGNLKSLLCEKKLSL